VLTGWWFAGVLVTIKDYQRWTIEVISLGSWYDLTLEFFSNNPFIFLLILPKQAVAWGAFVLYGGNHCQPHNLQIYQKQSTLGCNEKDETS
jgi:hypothetical protein